MGRCGAGDKIRGMNGIRRNDLSPRVEMLPLIDVVFLLLTFFIYAMIVLIQADSLRMKYDPVTGGQQLEQVGHRNVTIDLSGQVFLDGQRISLPALGEAFERMADQDPQPALFILTQSELDRQPGQAVVDRLPIFHQVLGLASQAGIEDYRAVGPKKSGEAGVR